MANSDELRSLIERTNRDLDEWNDFFEHTKAVWRNFGFWVEAGHTYHAQSVATGKDYTEADLTGLSQYYMSEHMAPIILQRYISVFESFVFGFLRLLLIVSPGSLATKTLKLGEIVSKPSIAAIIEEAVDEELNRIRYAKPKDWFEFMTKVQKLGCPSNDEIDRIAEIKATRDVGEHNSGIVNAIYRAKLGSQARFNEGECIEVSDSYLRDSWALLRKVCNDLATAEAKILSFKQFANRN